MNKTLVCAVLAALALTACGEQQSVQQTPAPQAETPSAEIVIQEVVASEVASEAQPESASETAVADPITARQEAFKKVGGAMESIGGMLKGKVAFDAEQFKTFVANMQQASEEAFQNFGEGTQGGNAKDELWANKADFDKGAEEMKAAIAALNEAAQTGNKEAIGPAVGAVGGTCKACHENFKKPVNK